MVITDMVVETIRSLVQRMHDRAAFRVLGADFVHPSHEFGLNRWASVGYGHLVHSEAKRRSIGSGVA